MPNFPTRLSDTMVLSAAADPLTGLSASELTFPMPTPLTNITIDTGLMDIPASRVKTLAVVVTTGLAWVTAGQPTVQLFAARTKYGVLGSTSAATVWGAAGGVSAPTTPFLGSSAAASGFPTGTAPNASAFVGGTTVLGPAAATTLATGIYWFSPGSPGNLFAAPSTSLAELQWWYPVLGVEVKFPSALTAGAFSVFLEVAPI